MALAQSTLSSLRLPLLSGLGAAGVLVLGVTGLTLFAGGVPEPVSVTTEIKAAIARVELNSTSQSVPFPAGPSDNASLPGVSDGAMIAVADTPKNPDLQDSEPSSGKYNLSNAPRAPFAGFFEPGPGGVLPIISADGIRPDQAYAKSFEGDKDAPSIALVVGGLGLSETVTRRAIRTLPAGVTLSFAPYARNLQDWIHEAREYGHEVLIELPMEPFDYPNNDPGPHTLLVDAAPEENQRRLLSLLARSAGYAGVINYQGARLSSAESTLGRIFENIEARGLTIVHDGAGRRASVLNAAVKSQARLAMADRVVDGNPSPDAIDKRLFELEALALQNGNALGSGFAYPATVDTITAWAKGLADRGYQLAPVSFLSELRNGPAVIRIPADKHSDDGHGNGHAKLKSDPHGHG